MKILILCFLSISTLGCKSKYERAFEEYNKREFYASPIKGEESWEEIELLSNVIKYQPGKSALYYYRAEQYELFEEFEKAVNDYETCIEQNFIFSKLFYQKGICELKLDFYEKARTDFIKAKELKFSEWENLPKEYKRSNHWDSPRFEHKEMLKKIEEKIKLSDRIK